jgi:hypothetical protein
MESEKNPLGCIQSFFAFFVLPTVFKKSNSKLVRNAATKVNKTRISDSTSFYKKHS